jgi:hypothetical protein
MVYFTLHPGGLKQFGYGLYKSDRIRRKALRQAVSASSDTHVIRQLNALRVLNKNTHPEFYSLLTDDMAYVRRV